MEKCEIKKYIKMLKKFIKKYGVGFLTEDQIRMCLIKSLELKAGNNAEIEKPYIKKENNNIQMFPIYMIDFVKKA